MPEYQGVTEMPGLQSVQNRKSIRPGVSTQWQKKRHLIYFRVAPTWTEAKPLGKKKKASLSSFILTAHTCYFASKGEDFLARCVVYNVKTESRFKQEISFQNYTATKNYVFGVLPHKQSRAYAGISLLIKTV